MSKSLVAFRIAATLTALGVLGQAVSAGALLSSPAGRAIHAQMALLVTVLALATVVTAVLVWRPGGGGSWAILPSTALLVLTIVQQGLGFTGIVQAHVPLGVLIFGGSLLLMTRAWRASPAPGPARASVPTS